MRKTGTFYFHLTFVLFICAFLAVPIFLSIFAGLTNNYLEGLSSGLTLRWLYEVWGLYSDSIGLTLQIAVTATLANLLLGVPCAYYLVRHRSRFSTIFNEFLLLPIAIPGMSLALGLIIVYGSAGNFRSSWLFILAGHVIFTLPFMVQSVLSVLRSTRFTVLEESSASLGANFYQRFFQVILPNCKTGIISGALMTMTLSVGEFNLTWMLHTPLTKTLPVGLADSYASMRLEISSAYTLIFLLLLLPLFIANQMFQRSSTPAKEPATKQVS